MPAVDDPRPDDDSAADDADEAELRRLAALAVAAVKGELTAATAPPDDRVAQRVTHVVDAIRGTAP